ncbi:DUF2788 domain-containing protein [Bacterioplanoides sp.]|uniref:DUF2788 domain-containing protein n=1 Tax=Bacterioplanoides sp. TaxID=2066072 RepID=UPI003B00B506
MNAEQFETWALRIGLTLLIGFMAFIIYDLGRRSNSGKFGMFVLFIGLFVGVAGFLIKIVLELMLNESI